MSLVGSVEVAARPVARLEPVIGGERYARLVKPGGRLVYATCSINRQENGEVRERFLAGHPEFEPSEALPRALGLGDGPELQLLPHRHGTDGFYIAALRRGRS